jgi:hypothetical protein
MLFSAKPELVGAIVMTGTTDRDAQADGQAEREIIGLLNLFAYILDHREWDRVGEVLARDATAYGETGLDDVVNKNIRRHLGGCGPSQHLLGNYRVDVAGDTATSLTYARVFHQGLGERSDRSWECMGEYLDAWTRTGEGWRMIRRQFDVRIMQGDFSVLQPG